MRLRLPFPVRLYLVVAFLISLACLVVFAALAEDVVEKDTIVEIDRMLAESLNQMVTSAQARLYWFISLFGSQAVFVIAAALGVHYVVRREWRRGVVWLIALGGGQVLNWLLKAAFARPRPVYAEQFVQEINTSFPSGHAMLSIICYGMIAYLAMRLTSNRITRILIAFTAVMIVVLISISRLYLGVHYLSDVLAGLAAGGVWLSGCIGVMEWLRHRSANTSL